MFRSEDELDLEGIKVTLTNGISSTEVLGVSCDSTLHTTLDLSDFNVKRIRMQTAKQFKPPIGFQLSSGSQVKDVVSALYDDEPPQMFKTTPYAELQPGQEIIGIYGYS